MKTIISYIRESLGKGTMFKDKVKYTSADWTAWCKEVSSNKNIEIFDVEENKQKLHLIYLDNKHIATYNPKTQELMTDDISHFGHVVTEGEEKKDDKTIEVQDGWKGRILPFALVQQAFFSSDVEDIASIESSLSNITSEFEVILDSLSEEELQKLDDRELNTILRVDIEQ